jgi:hypothetical protein
MKAGFTIMTETKTILPMEKLTETEKGETGEEQCQENSQIFFDIKGTVHKEFVLVGQTVNSAYDCDILR